MEESVTFKVGRFWNLDFFHACSVRLKPVLPVSVSVKPSLGRVSDYFLALNVMLGAMCRVCVESGVISATGSEESRP